MNFEVAKATTSGSDVQDEEEIELNEFKVIDSLKTDNNNMAKGHEGKEGSLQEAFMKFRKKRQAEIRLIREMKEKSLAQKMDPEHMWELRMRFLERAKHYYGVPYAKRYHSPDSPDYNAPLFLDCCGLVRRVLLDLKDDFGFKIGSWNQAYQYDTLPITIQREEDMKPGDLVFISAIYYNPKSKKQRHNMVHVEIWAGEGAKSVGARWQRGHVQMFDSYTFKAKSYHSMVYHFKSIDTWLQGICRSHCPEHEWTVTSYQPGQKSIFALQDDSCQGQAAEDSCDDVSDEENGCSIEGYHEIANQGDTEGQNLKEAVEILVETKEESIEVDKVAEIKDDTRIHERFESQENREDWSLEKSQDMNIEGILLDKRVTIKDESDANNNRLEEQGDCLEGSFESKGGILANKDLKIEDGDSMNRLEEQGERRTHSLEALVNETEGILEDEVIKIKEDDANDNKLKEQRDGRTQNHEPTVELEVEGIVEVKVKSKADVDSTKLTQGTGEVSHNLKGTLEMTCKGFQGDWGCDTRDNKVGPPTEVEHGDSKSYATEQDCPEEKLDSKTAVQEENDFTSRTQTEDTRLFLEDVENDIYSEEDPPHDVPECCDCNASHGCQGDKCCHDDNLEPQDGDDGKRTSNKQSEDAVGKNSKTSTDKQSSQKGKRSQETDNDDEGTSDPKDVTSPRSSVNKELGPTFYIGGANGVALVEGPLLAKGWRRIHDRTNEYFKLKWVELKSHINYHSFRPGEQLVNRIPNMAYLATKVGLLETLREYERVNQRVQRRKGKRCLMMEAFHPETYTLDSKADREAFYAAHQDGDTWISKPNSMNQGKGIYLVKDISEIQRKYQTMEESGSSTTMRKGNSSRIVQRYVPNPLLLDRKKFDVRAYMLIACTTPYVVFYHPGYLRLSCDSYDPTSDDLSLHLTNQYVQKKNPVYSDMKEETVWSMDRFNDHVNTLAKDKGLPMDWVHNQFTKRMMQIMTHCFNAVKNKLQCKLGYFDLLGFDFLLDENMKVYLLEVNVNPALHTNCEALRNQIPPIIHETLDVVLEIFEKCRHSRPIMPLTSQRRLTLLHSEAATSSVSRHMSHSTSPPRPKRSPARTTSPLRTARSRSTSPVKRGVAVKSLRKNVTKMTVKDAEIAPGPGTG